MNDITIRQADLNDIPILALFQKQMAQETENIHLNDSILNEGLHSLLTDSAKGKYYVAELNNHVVGCLMITFEWSDWRNGVFWWIQSVYVVAERRMRVLREEGIFSMLERGRAAERPAAS